MSLFVVVAAGVLFGFPDRLRSAVYVPPAGAPPTGDQGLPINISASYQVKEGGLTLTNGLQVTSPTGNPNLEVNGRINWNGDVQSAWPSATIPGEQLVAITATTPPEQTGWMHVIGTNDTTNPDTLKVVSPKPTLARPTYGVWGLSNVSAIFAGTATYGVYAEAGANSGSNFAVHANAPAVTSWGGYFAGNVAVLTPFDLVIGQGTLTQGSSPTTGEICLNDVCRSSWPTASDAYWSDAGTSIEAITPSRDIAVGGSDANAQFFAQKLPSGNMVVEANGTGSSNVLVIQ